jgi:hypothetical protein
MGPLRVFFASTFCASIVFFLAGLAHAQDTSYSAPPLDQPQLAQGTYIQANATEVSQTGRGMTGIRLEKYNTTLGGGKAFVVYGKNGGPLTCYKIENLNLNSVYWIPDGGSSDLQAQKDFGALLNDPNLSQIQLRISTIGFGQAEFPNCKTSLGGPAACSLAGNTISSGSFITAYQSATGNPCVSEQRTCTNGILSGSYAFASCSAPSATCSVPSQVVSLPLSSCIPIQNYRPLWNANGDLCLSGPHGSDRINGIVGFNFDLSAALATVPTATAVRVTYTDTNSEHQHQTGYLNTRMQMSPSASADSGYIWPLNHKKDFGLWMQYNGSTHILHVESAARGWGDCSQYGALGCNASVTNSVRLNFATPTCPIIDGQCGTAIGDFGRACPAPTTNFCADGSTATVTGGRTSGGYTWTCPGNNGGDTAVCMRTCSVGGH